MKKSNRQRVHSNYYVEIVFFCNNNNNFYFLNCFPERHPKTPPFVFSQKNRKEQKRWWSRFLHKKHLLSGREREMSSSNNTQDATASPSYSNSSMVTVEYDYLAVLYALLASVAFVQLIRIQKRNSIVWTTQKSFVVLNFFVMSVRAVVFAIRERLDEIEPRVFASILLDLPGLIFFTTCAFSSSSSSSSSSLKNLSFSRVKTNYFKTTLLTRRKHGAF